MKNKPYITITLTTEEQQVLVHANESKDGIILTIKELDDRSESRLYLNYDETTVLSNMLTTITNYEKNS